MDKCRIGSLLLLFSLIFNTIFAQTGPAGIGNNDGSNGEPENIIWLDANNISQTNGTAVASWPDKSGNSNNFAQGIGNNQPTFYNSGGANGQNFVNFLRGADVSQNDRIVLNPFNGIPTTQFSVIMIYRTSLNTSANDAMVSYATGNGGNSNHLILYRNSNFLANLKNSNSNGSGIAFNDTNWSIGSTRWRNSDGTLSFNKNGTSATYTQTNFRTSQTIPVGGSLVIGGEQDDVDDDYAHNQAFDGDIAEIIFYSNYIDDAQRIIIENYLSQKYAITIPNDFVGNDADYSASYHDDIVGMGTTNGTTKVSQSGLSSAFFVRERNGSLDATNEFVMVAHDGTVVHAENIVSDLGPGIVSRWQKDYYVEFNQNGTVDGASVDVDLIFDFGDAGFTIGNAADYVLLFRAGTSGNYTVVSTEEYTIESTDQLVAKVSSSQLRTGYYTLGVGSQALTRTWYVLKDGNWNDPTIWTLDAGVAPAPNNPGNETPQAGDDVMIRNGKKVTIQSTTNNLIVASIVVEGELDVTTSKDHNFNFIEGSGTIRIAGNSSTINFPAGNTITANGFADRNNGGTLIMYGTGFTINSDYTFNNVNIQLADATDVVILGADLTLNGKLKVTNGVLQFGDGTTNSRTFNAYGDVKVENNGITKNGSISTANANARHEFNLYGDFLNQGTVSFTQRTTPDYNNEATNGIVDFNILNDSKDQTIECNGETNFYRIEISKGVDDTYIATLQADDPNNFNLLGPANYNIDADNVANDNAFALLSGTAKVGTNIDIPVINNIVNYSIASASRLWIDGGSVSKNSGTALVVYGVLEISAGTLNVLAGSGITIREAGKFKADGGNTITKVFRTSVQGATAQGTYEQNGGNVTLTGGSGINNSYAIFALTYTGNVFKMSGGTLTIQGRNDLGPLNLRGTIFINCDPANQNITGGTVIFESNTVIPFKVTSRAPFYNLTMRSTVASAGNFTLEETTCGQIPWDGSSIDEPTLGAQPLVVLNDLKLEALETDVNNEDVKFYPVTSDANVNDVYIGGSFIVERGAQYISCYPDFTSGTEDNYDGISDQPTSVNTTYFNQTIGTGLVESIYWGNDQYFDYSGGGADDNQNRLEFGNLVLNRTTGYELRESAIATHGNSSILIDVNGDVQVLSGILDQSRFTLRIWGNVTNNEQLGTYYESGPYPTSSGTPSAAQIRLREDDNANFNLTTSDDAIFGNIRFNINPNYPISVTSNLKILRLEYMRGFIYLGAHNLTINEMWKLDNGQDASQTRHYFSDIENSSLLEVKAATTVGTNSTRSGEILIYTNGLQSDGGLTLKVTGNTIAETENSRRDNEGPITFPIGFTLDNGVTVYNRPAQMKVENYVADGYVTIRPVSGELQTTDLSGGEVLQHYWNVEHDFADADKPDVAFRFYYFNQDGVGNVDLLLGAANEASYVPGYVLSDGTYLRKFESSPAEDNDDIDASTYDANIRFVVFNGTSTGADFTNGSFVGFKLVEANFTTGVSPRFVGAPKIYYTRMIANAASTGWQNGSLWTLATNDLDGNTTVDPDEVHDSSQPQAGTWPGAGDVAVIGWVPWDDPNTGQRGYPHGVGIGNISPDFAELRFSQMLDVSGNPTERVYYQNFQFRPTVCINPNGGLSGKIVSGEGMFWFRSDGGTQVDPDLSAVDFGDFVREDSSYFVYESTSSAFVYDNIPSETPNLMVATDGWGSQDKDFEISTDVTVNGDLEVLGDANLILSSGAEGDIHIKRNLRLLELTVNNSGGGGEISFPNDVSRTIEVEGDLSLENQGSTIHIRNADNTIVVSQLIVHGNIVQDNTTGGGLQLSTDDEDYVKLILKGTGNNSYTVNSGSIASLHAIELNKGTDTTSSFTFNNNFTLPDIDDTNQQPIEIVNGKLVINNASIDVVLANENTGDFYLPNTNNTESSSGSGSIEIVQGRLAIEGDDTGLILDGKLAIKGGTLDMATAVGNGNNFIEYSSSGNAIIEVTSGTLDVGSQIRRSLTAVSGILDYTQTGGTVRVGVNAAPEDIRGVFEVLNDGSQFTHTGGDLIIVQQNGSSSVGSLILKADNYDLTGSVISIGDASAPLNQNSIGIDANIPLNELVITGNNNLVAKTYINDLELNNLTIQSSGTFNANGLHLTVNNDLDNDGVFAVSGTAINDQTTYFPASTPQTISGTGTFSFYNIDKAGTGTLTVDQDVIIDNELNIYAGTIATGAHNVNLKGDMIHDGTHSSDVNGPGIVFNGTSKQNLSRTGLGESLFGTITINNAYGVEVNAIGRDFQINHKVILRSGVLNIGSNLLIMDEDAIFENGSGGTARPNFNTGNMITVNTSLVDKGVRKIYPDNFSGTYLYPVGLNYYTPVEVTATDIDASVANTGFITVKPIDNYSDGIQEDTDELCVGGNDWVDADNVLQYYWLIKSRNITNFDGSFTMYYDNSMEQIDNPDGLTEANYAPARLLNLDDTWDKNYSSTLFDETNNIISFKTDPTTDYADLTSDDIVGRYTAGITKDNTDALLCGSAIPDIVPMFETLAMATSGDVDDGNSYLGAIAPTLGQSPDLNVNGDFTLLLNDNYRRFRRVTIDAGATLTVDETYGHQLGTVLGEGTLKLVNTASFPAGDYDDFFPDANCSVGGGLEYEVTTGNSATVLSAITNVRSVVLSGDGSKSLPANSTVNICENLEIRDNGAFAMNNNSTLNIKGNIIKESTASFDAVSYSNAAIALDGSSAQTIDGDFTGVEAFSSLEVDNASGITVVNTNNDDVEVSSELIFTNGLIRTNTNNSLIIGQNATLSGYSSASYVNGPLIRTKGATTASNYDPFPVGHGARYGLLELSYIQLPVAENWTVQYYNATPPSIYSLTPAAVSAGVEKTSGNEYWSINVSSTNSPQSNVRLHWTSASDVQSTISNMRMVFWDASGGGTQWDVLPNVNAPSGSATSGYLTSGPLSYSTKYVTFGTLDASVTPLPVELIEFTAKSTGGAVKLEWTTASELNNDYFEVQRSFDGETYEVIGTVEGNGTTKEYSEYNFIDAAPITGLNYYRLRQVDCDGQFEYSFVVSVEIGGGLAEALFSPVLFPNPTHQQNISLRIATEDMLSKVHLVIYDLRGMVIHTEKIDPELLAGDYEIKVAGKMNTGLYLMKIKQAQHERTLKLLIE